jgi:CRP-like cAMP-binding protein
MHFDKYEPIYSQGDSGEAVFYIQKGKVKLSVVNSRGKGAVLALLGPGDFFGEGCLATQPLRSGTATAMAATTVLLIEKAEMIRVLHAESAFAERFTLHMLSRIIRSEQDLADQLFNSTERRLARALLLQAGYGTADKPQKTVGAVSQEMLAEIIGTTRPRVNFLMNKFRKLGFIDYDAESLTITNSLLSFLLDRA